MTYVTFAPLQRHARARIVTVVQRLWKLGGDEGVTSLAEVRHHPISDRYARNFAASYNSIPNASATPA
jgi:hypothetical protein